MQLKKNNINEINDTSIMHTPEQVISEILTQIIDIILLIQNKAKSGDT